MCVCVCIHMWSLLRRRVEAIRKAYGEIFLNNILYNQYIIILLLRNK